MTEAKIILNRGLDKVQRLSEGGIIPRLLNNPLNYIFGQLYRRFYYKVSKKEKEASARTFFNMNMRVALPAGLDIYFIGGKSHDSEIRLARFLIRQLNQGDGFLDIGAHFGYFTLLAEAIVGDKGRILSYEPAAGSFDILKKNVARFANIRVFNMAVADSDDAIQFYVFPTYYSEFNTSTAGQFEKEGWYSRASPEVLTVDAVTIDSLTQQYDFIPDVIKIDVEGAEHAVIAGGSGFFRDHCPLIVMEYLSPERQNESHKAALKQLSALGYRTYLIDAEGDPALVQDSYLDKYLVDKGLDSDNIVLMKR